MQQPIIAVDLTPLLPGGANGGIKTYILECIPWLRRRFAGKTRFLFLTSSISHDEVRRSLCAPDDRLVCVNVNSPVQRWEFLGRGDQDFLWKNPPTDLLWRLSADLLYCPFGATTWHCPGVPTVSLVADLLHLDFPASLSEEERAHRHCYFTKMAADAEAFQCISDYGASRLAQAYGVGRDRLFRTYLVLGGRLRHTPSAAKDAGRPFFFYPANFWPHKNHPVLLAAYADYVAQAGDEAWDLVLTGADSPETRALLAQADTADLAGRLRYEGHVGPHRLEQLWACASALVFPSLHEGFGIPLVEAMAFGLPIICGRATCLGEVAGDAALFANPAEPSALSAAMLRMTRDDELRRELAATSAARLEFFDFGREMDALAGALQRQLQAGPSRPTIIGLEDGFVTNGQVLLHPGKTGWHKLSAIFGQPGIPTQMRLRCGHRIFGTWPMGEQEDLNVDANFLCNLEPVILDFLEADVRAPRPVAVACKRLSVRACGAPTSVNFQTCS